MTKILAINSSVEGATSVSRILVDETVRRLKQADASAEIISRNLGASPVPHLRSDTVAGVRGTPATELEYAARALSDELISELRSADTVVIGAPMYNFSVATGLRAWFDHVLRAGETFQYTESGPKGLLVGKRAVVLESRGGLYSEGPAKIFDFQEPYLKHLFGFMGITDVTFIRAEKIGLGSEAREVAIAAAINEIVAYTATFQKVAA